MPTHHSVEYFPDNHSLNEAVADEPVSSENLLHDHIALVAHHDLAAEESITPNLAEMSLNIPRTRPIEDIRTEQSLEKGNSLHSSDVLPDELDPGIPAGPNQPDSHRTSYAFDTSHDQCRKATGLISSLPCQRFVAGFSWF